MQKNLPSSGDGDGTKEHGFCARPLFLQVRPFAVDELGAIVLHIAMGADAGERVLALQPQCLIGP